ncbi:hypothetical protein TTHERM_01353100 (macronuclear) [Tetrahymena thermophila SB210]|uniref:Uncharacterized protein n=1 Tax=Tetrahymena thermophila (strain SB210) TaxID=312017 RepID=Q23KN7_TETTS|nr:hypothetical protein TTHERM_01353100 [Tetrahymena thermophila SB210]EAR97082.2 hypothetical protein TTHERM_01353100 [Tetrahymena thermophila SB210]|eukprot:XP_001017327.2 hypothetical protein TTHERM_01353100 [Tetrahymena thermophila SB210]
MGCVNGVQNNQNLKNKIKKMLNIMIQYEEKINFINQQFLADLQEILTSDEYQIDEQIIIVVENKSECETICSQLDCSTKKEQILIENYQKQIAEQNDKIKPLINQALFYIQNFASIQSNVEFPVLRQCIKKFQQNGFSYKIITIQQINQKQKFKTNLDIIGALCESVIIQ